MCPRTCGMLVILTWERCTHNARYARTFYSMNLLSITPIKFTTTYTKRIHINAQNVLIRYALRNRSKDGTQWVKSRYVT